jgi:hypothetical protein
MIMGLPLGERDNSSTIIDHADAACRLESATALAKGSATALASGMPRAVPCNRDRRARMTQVAVNHVDRLIREMSLAEKLGQLTMTAAGSTVTGPTIAGDSTEAIRAGTIGNLLNLTGAAQVREMQRLAVEESRLGIPLLI